MPGTRTETSRGRFGSSVPLRTLTYNKRREGVDDALEQRRAPSVAASAVAAPLARHGGHCDHRDGTRDRHLRDRGSRGQQPGHGCLGSGAPLARPGQPGGTHRVPHHGPPHPRPPAPARTDRSVRAGPASGSEGLRRLHQPLRRDHSRTRRLRALRGHGPRRRGERPPHQRHARQAPADQAGQGRPARGTGGADHQRTRLVRSDLVVHRDLARRQSHPARQSPTAGPTLGTTKPSNGPIRTRSGPSSGTATATATRTRRSRSCACRSSDSG
jgi:hypothetical protein